MRQKERELRADTSKDLPQGSEGQKVLGHLALPRVSACYFLPLITRCMLMKAIVIMIAGMQRVSGTFCGRKVTVFVRAKAPFGGHAITDEPSSYPLSTLTRPTSARIEV